MADLEDEIALVVVPACVCAYVVIKVNECLGGER